MFKIILRLFKYINIVFAGIVLFSILSFLYSYLLDSKNKEELKKVVTTFERNNLEISTLKEIIESRAKINQKIIDESLVKDEIIAFKIKEILGEILDKDIGLFKIVNLKHSVDDNYINLYRTSIDVLYTKNKLFTFYDLQGEVLKEINKKIKMINSSELELKIESFNYDDTTSNLNITILTKKTVITENN